MIEPAKLSPKQTHSIARAIDGADDLYVWDGAVRSGKTLASMLAWLELIRTLPAGPLLMVGRTIDTLARNIMDPLAEMFGPLAPQAVRYTRGANTARILGRLVYCVGANDVQAEAKIRGLTLVGAYVDEATLVPEPFWKMLITRLSVPGSKLLATTNPDNLYHWLRRDVLLNPKIRLTRFTFQLDDNPALTERYKEGLKAQLAGMWYRRYVQGIWCAAEGAIYDMFDPDLHVVTQLPNMRDLWWVGIDYGTANPFHAGLLGVGEDQRLYVVDEWRYSSVSSMRQKTDVEYSAAVRMWLLTAGGRVLGQPVEVHPKWTAVDPSAASFKAQLRRDGMTGVMDADNRVLDGIQAVSSLLAADRLRIHARCKGLLDEIPGYVWDPKKAEKGEDAPLKENDHGCDMLRYSCMAARSEWGKWLKREQAA